MKKITQKQKNRPHQLHKTFRTQRCFYNLISKQLSAKREHVFLNFSCSAVLTIEQKISNVLPQSHMAVSKCISLQEGLKMTSLQLLQLLSKELIFCSVILGKLMFNHLLTHLEYIKHQELECYK